MLIRTQSENSKAGDDRNMARFIQEPSSKDMLAKMLYSLLDDTWLIVPSMPHPNQALMASREGGAMLVVLVDSNDPPVVSEEGGVLGLDHGLLVREAKNAMGKECAGVPIAVLAWFPLMDETLELPEGANAVAIHYGTDLNALALTMMGAIENGSTPLDEIMDALENNLRSGPKSIPHVLPDVAQSNSPVVKIVPGIPMNDNDPILLLIGQGIRNEVGTALVSYAGVAVSVPDLQAPSSLLPALLVVAAETWASADMKLEGKGGFHIHLVSIPGDNNSWTGFAVADVQASIVLLVTLGVNAVLRSCRRADGSIVLDTVLVRFSRFMELNGHAGVDIKSMKSMIEDDDGY